MPSIKKCNLRNPAPPCPSDKPYEELLNDGKTKCCYKKKKLPAPTPAPAAPAATSAPAAPAATHATPVTTSEPKKLPRCPKGTRRNKKSGKCEKVVKSKSKSKSKDESKNESKDKSKGKCSNDTDPFTMDDISEEDTIRYNMKNGEVFCFDRESLWGMVKSNIETNLALMKEISDNKFDNIKPIDGNIYGINGNLLDNEKLRQYFVAQAKEIVKTKVVKNLNKPYTPPRDNMSDESIWNDFLQDRIDTENNLHLEGLTNAIFVVGPNCIQNHDWTNLVQIIHGSWISNNYAKLGFLSSITNHARMQFHLYYLRKDKVKIFVHLLIKLYNQLLLQTKDHKETRSDFILLLYILQQNTNTN